MILINLLLWIVGAVSGALHPFGLILGIAETAVFLWSAAAIGTLASIRSKSTMCALVITIAAVVFINGGYLLGCAFMPDTSVLIATGCSPFALGASMLSYEDVWAIFGFARDRGYGFNLFAGEHGVEYTAFIIFATAFHFVLALFATGLSLGMFDIAADRPRTDFRNISSPRPSLKLKQTEEV